MAKKNLKILALLLLLIPANVSAINASKDYVSMNLEETLADEKIEITFSNYKETDEQAIIYLFRGKGCIFCHSFLNYLNSITDEYGDYFKLVSYEVWQDSHNANLLKEVSEFLGEPATGIPYIIIGNQVFPGYDEYYNEDIENAVIELYKSKNKYDIFEEMATAEKDENSSTSIINIIIWNAIFVILGTSIILYFINDKDKKINSRINELEKKLNL